MNVIEVYRCIRCGYEIRMGKAWTVPEHALLSTDPETLSPFAVINGKKLLHCCIEGKWGMLTSAGLDAVEG